MVSIIIVGGFGNLFSLFKDLKTARRSDADDGTVIGHHNLADEKILGDKLDDDSNSN